MTTTPVPAGAGFPLQLELDAPANIARWRPIVQWFLAIPHFVVLYALAFVQRVVLLVSFFAILFTGQMPEGLFGFNAMVLRYQWRAASYAMFMREDYPQFAFPTEGQDPATEPARLSVEPAPKLSRGLSSSSGCWRSRITSCCFSSSSRCTWSWLSRSSPYLITGYWPAGMRAFVVGRDAVGVPW